MFDFIFGVVKFIICPVYFRKSCLFWVDFTLDLKHFFHPNFYFLPYFSFPAFCVCSHTFIYICKLDFQPVGNSNSFHWQSLGILPCLTGFCLHNTWSFLPMLEPFILFRLFPCQILSTKCDIMSVSFYRLFICLFIRHLFYCQIAT